MDRPHCAPPTAAAQNQGFPPGPLEYSSRAETSRNCAARSLLNQTTCNNKSGSFVARGSKGSGAQSMSVPMRRDKGSLPGVSRAQWPVLDAIISDSDSPVSRSNTAPVADSVAGFDASSSLPPPAGAASAAPAAVKLKPASEAAPFSHLDSLVTAGRVSASAVSHALNSTFSQLQPLAGSDV